MQNLDNPSWVTRQIPKSLRAEKVTSKFVLQGHAYCFLASNKKKPGAQWPNASSDNSEQKTITCSAWEPCGCKTVVMCTVTEPGLIQIKLEIRLPDLNSLNRRQHSIGQDYIKTTQADMKALCVETMNPKILTSSSGQTGMVWKSKSRAGQKHERKTETPCQHDEHSFTVKWWFYKYQSNHTDEWHVSTDIVVWHLENPVLGLVFLCKCACVCMCLQRENLHQAYM